MIPTRPRSLKPCATCGKLVPGGSRHCPTCAQAYNRRENKRSAKYQTTAWRNQRERVLGRDRRQCTICGSTERLHIHHLDRDADSPIVMDHRLVTLCQYHHGQLEMNHRYGKACPVQTRLDQHLADSPHHGDTAREWDPFG